MVNWQAFVAVYFGFSITMLCLGMCVERKIGVKTNLTVFVVFLVLLFGPIAVVVNGILDLFYPSAGNLIDIVYSKLSYSEEKTSGMILEEIKVAGESLGRSEKNRIENILDVMVSMGFAKREMASLKNLIIKGASEFDKAILRIPDEVLDEKVKGGARTFVNQVQNLPEDDLLLIPVYLKGVPPKRRGLRDKFFRFGWQPLPAYTRPVYYYWPCFILMVN